MFYYIWLAQKSREIFISEHVSIFHHHATQRVFMFSHIHLPLQLHIPQPGRGINTYECEQREAIAYYVEISRWPFRRTSIWCLNRTRTDRKRQKVKTKKRISESNTTFCHRTCMPLSDPSDCALSYRHPQLTATLTDSSWAPKIQPSPCAQNFSQTATRIRLTHLLPTDERSPQTVVKHIQLPESDIWRWIRMSHTTLHWCPAMTFQPSPLGA